MNVLLRRESATTAADVAFLRDRCSYLQRTLDAESAFGLIETEAFEGDVLRRWTQLLVRDDPWPVMAQMALEELYVLHARVQERILRGGVGDISRDVECLVRALLVDQLQRSTDAAVTAIS